MIYSRLQTYLTARLQPMTPADAATFYNLLRDYYENNGLYDAMAAEQYAMAQWQPAMKGLRNPAYRAVEFYAAHLWPGVLPGALPVKSENPRLIDPIKLVWKWSNMNAKKQVGARQFSMLGDMVIKVSQEPGRVFQQFIDPAYLTDFSVDLSGFLTFARFDFPQLRRSRSGSTAYWHTEIWSEAAQAVWIYEHTQGIGAEQDQLGDPVYFAEFKEFGIDFIPIVISQFRDIGKGRGACCFMHALDKIDEVNRQATRLHQMLFKHNDVTHAIKANAELDDGTPLPPPRFANQRARGDIAVTEIAGHRFIALPGHSSLEQLVPNINYDSALKIVEAQLVEIERDLPELTYYRLPDMGQLSGVAVQRLLGAAIKRAEEARGNGEAALIRANQIAITLGQIAGLPGFDVGLYEAGDLEHEFEKREIIPIAELELMSAIKTAVDAGIPLAEALKRFGWSKEDIAAVEEAKARDRAADAATLAQAVLAARRQQDQNATPALVAEAPGPAFNSPNGAGG